MKIHGIHISKGNSKVKFPILNLQAATDCSSRKWCPFDKDNYKRSGRKQCYAQKTERLRPNALASRRMNQEIIESLKGETLSDVAKDVAAELFDLVRHKNKRNRIVRFNESGDISKDNIEFACEVIMCLGALGVRVYLYSKAQMIYQNMAKHAGATVLHSERDFVAVPTEVLGEGTGLAKCPGICGPCTACPDGKKSWILEH